MSLWDVIRRSRELASPRVKHWKRRGAVIEARRRLAEWHTWEQPQGEMAQHAHEMCGEGLYDELVWAEYEFLGGADGGGGKSGDKTDDDATWQLAQVRASEFALKSMVLVKRVLREPEHPFLFTEKDSEE